MQVTIVTPTGVKFAGEAAGVTAPSVMGDVGVLPGHQPMMAALRTGEALVQVPGRDPLHLVIDGGYLHVVGGDHVSIVTELCEGWHDVDAAKAKADYDTALAALTATRDDISSAIWQVRKHDVELAETRMRVAAAKP
jgi:F-type H+-transporting ATPase subunit epsilon